MASNTELVPYKDEVVDENRKLSSVWSSFFRIIQDIIFYVKPETYFDLVNNQAVAANITPLVFDKRFTSYVVIDYVIQRMSSGADLVQGGILLAVYRPFSNTWSLVEYGTPGPSASGITFSITSAGQIKYTSTNMAGTVVLSRIVFRTRPFQGKSQLFSLVGS